MEEQDPVQDNRVPVPVEGSAGEGWVREEEVDLVVSVSAPGAELPSPTNVVFPVSRTNALNAAP